MWKINSRYAIKRLTAADIIKALILLQNHADTTLLFADLLKFVILRDHDAFIIADNSDLVGLIAGHQCDSTSYIDILCVGKDHRRQGLAKLLLQHFLESQVAPSALALDVRVSNNAAQHVYERWGFTKSGTKALYYRTEDSYTMTKEITG